ncbi:MAG: DNA polymerase III subunit gamma/tau [Clostridia bacterium]|nr:DNA polymerase III subunit gamma/tau [Clostridia bacterium]
MYQALYRKYRPKTFDEVVGQEHITTTLKNQVSSGNISHAYLFTGSRGTGKTTCAKIFARAINCEQNKNGSPCYDCSTCNALADVSNVDIMEIDAASNNRVDEIREIREKVKFMPVNGKYKVYIIDEVHMLTESAFNALLKTLEEPPAHVVFVLATTEVHKLPATILSRCMRFDFRLISVSVLANQLKQILDKENITYEDDAIKLIASSAEGSDRDMLSIADCVIAFCGNNITAQKVIEILGQNDKETYINLAEAIYNKDVGTAFELIENSAKAGKNMSVFAKDITSHFRNLLIVKTCKNYESLLGLTKNWAEKLCVQANGIPTENLMEYMKIFSGIESELKYALSPKTLIETAVASAITCFDEKKND